MEPIELVQVVQGIRGPYRVEIRRTNEAGRISTCFDVTLPTNITRRVWNRNDLAILIATHEQQLNVLWDNVSALTELETLLLDNDI